MEFADKVRAMDDGRNQYSSIRTECGHMLRCKGKDPYLWNGKLCPRCGKLLRVR